MLRHLSISNYVLIRELDIDFPPGLNIITGETGAGKSIMLGALSLLLGKKADSSVFFDAGRNCVVEGDFEIDGEEILLRRVITPAGRSRAFLNDEPVSVATLGEMSSRIVDIHEQHQSKLLSDPEYQLHVLDSYAGDSELVSEYRSVWNTLQEKRSALATLKSAMASAARDRDYRQFQFDQLSAASLREGELVEIEAEHRMLSNAENIKNELLTAAAAIESEGFSITHNLREASAALSKAEKFLPEISGLSERLTGARIEIEDIDADIEKAAGDVNVSPARLAEVEERMDTLYSLMKKHDVSSVEGLIQLRNELDRALSGEEIDRQSLADLEKEISGLAGELDLMAAQLTSVRRSAADSFSAGLQKGIRELEMPYAQFSIELAQKNEPGQSGRDDIRFLFSANGGRTPGDLSKVASGGELSRVMLSLKRLISEYTSLPTMIFDEIDTGVSGRMADRMGRMIAGMGGRMQIFAITHLPQIASQDGAHFLIQKKMGADGAETVITRLGEQERVTEVARMLSGDTLTGAALENARTLLNENKQHKTTSTN